MTQNQLNKILKRHYNWLEGKKNGERANLKYENLSGLTFIGVDLRYADLVGANLSYADLTCAYLSEADLTNANLSHANLNSAELNKTILNNTILNDASLQKAKLIGAKLEKAQLIDADLSESNLTYANLSYAKLQYANLSYAKLKYANLKYTNLKYANLSCIDLSYTNLKYIDLSETKLIEPNLSGAKNLLNAIDFMETHFKKTNEGYIVYKTFGSKRTPNPNWKITENSIIEEVVDHTRTQLYGCGINAGSFNWVKQNYPDAQVYKLLIKFEWLSEVCVPYNTNGNIRCGRAKIIEKVDN